MIERCMNTPTPSCSFYARIQWTADMPISKLCYVFHSLQMCFRNFEICRPPLQCVQNQNPSRDHAAGPSSKFLQEHEAHAPVKSELHLSFFSPPDTISNMSKARSESSEDFEFIETPAAPTPIPPVEDCGVRTTSVFLTVCHFFSSSTNLHSIQPSKMLPSQPMPLAAIPSIITCSLPSSASCHGTWLA
jgi:hypothetical protein